MAVWPRISAPTHRKILSVHVFFFNWLTSELTQKKSWASDCQVCSRLEFAVTVVIFAVTNLLTNQPTHLLTCWFFRVGDSLWKPAKAGKPYEEVCSEIQNEFAQQHIDWLKKCWTQSHASSMLVPNAKKQSDSVTQKMKTQNRLGDTAFDVLQKKQKIALSKKRKN